MKKMIDIKALVISVIVASISLLTDRLIFDFYSFEKSRYIKLKVIYFVIVIILGQLLKALLSLARQNKTVLKAVKVTGVCILFCTACLIIVYPGIWIWDNCEMLRGASCLALGGWHGYYMEHFFAFSLMLLPFPAGIIILQIIFIAAIIGREFYLIYSVVENKKLSYIILATVLLPTSLFWILSPYRTAVFGFLVGLETLEFLLMKKAYNGEWNTLIYYAILYSFTWSFRSEGYVLLLFIPIIAYFISKINWKKGAFYLIFSLALVLIVKAPIKSNRAYLTMSLMNPMELMMRHNLNSDDINRDLSSIDKVFSVLAMKSSASTVYAVNGPESAVNKEGFLDNIYCSKEEWNEMLKAYANVIFFNPQLFLKLRWGTFVPGITSSKGAIDTIENCVSGVMERFMFDSFPLTSPISEDMRQSFGRMLGRMGSICGTAVIPACILLCGFVLGIGGGQKELWGSVMVQFLMLAVVFIAEPASNSAYFYPFYNTAYLLLVFGLINMADYLINAFKQKHL